VKEEGASGRDDLKKERGLPLLTHKFGALSEVSREARVMNATLSPEASTHVQLLALSRCTLVSARC